MKHLSKWFLMSMTMVVLSAGAALADNPPQGQADRSQYGARNGAPGCGSTTDRGSSGSVQNAGVSDPQTPRPAPARAGQAT